MTNTSDQIMLVKALGNIVKDQALLRSLDLLLRVLEPPRPGHDEVISAPRKLLDPQQVPEGLAAIFNESKCRRWLFEAKRLVNQRGIDVGLVSELESVKKDVKALEVGFQQSSIETTLANAIYTKKQLVRCITRVTSTVAKLSGASKMQHNDMTVDMQIALTSKTDAFLNLQVFQRTRTLVKEPFSLLFARQQVRDEAMLLFGRCFAIE